MICDGGTSGSNLTFNRTGGQIQDVKTGRNSQFIKRQGVYFIRLRIPKEDHNAEEHTDFVRPGQP